MKIHRVLLADDHAVVRAGIRDAIEGLDNLKVIAEAADGPTLQAALQAHQPDLLIIDVSMPDFDPIPEIQNFRDQYPDMRILVISAYDDDVYVQGLLQAGVSGYHLKDQSLKDLRLALQRVINGEKWISSPLVDKLINLQEPSIVSSPLSSRQRDILHQLMNGQTNQAIALELNLSVKTIENHLTRIYRTLGVQNRVEAVNHLNQNPHLLGSSGDLPHLTTSPLTASKRVNLLLVDDNPHYRQQLKRRIGSIASHTAIFEADSIENAVQFATKITFQLILVDVLLGEENGILCAKKLKKVSPQSRIILISAYPDKEFRRQSLNAGASAFIDKKLLDSASLKQILDDLAY